MNIKVLYETNQAIEKERETFLTELCGTKDLIVEIQDENRKLKINVGALEETIQLIQQGKLRGQILGNLFI